MQNLIHIEIEDFRKRKKDEGFVPSKSEIPWYTVER
jgi:hypothetical protein